MKKIREHTKFKVTSGILPCGLEACITQNIRYKYTIHVHNGKWKLNYVSNPMFIWLFSCAQGQNILNKCINDAF